MAPVVKARVKLEINTREHFAVHGVVARPFEVDNSWYSGGAEISTYSFLSDVPPLLRAGVEHNPAEAWSRVHPALVSHLPGDPWKRDDGAD